MRPVVDAPDPGAGDVRVDLRRRDVGVAEHHLDGAEVGVVVDEMGREGVAEDVRRDGRGREAGLPRGRLQREEDGLARDGLSARAREDPAARGAPLSPARGSPPGSAPPSGPRTPRPGRPAPSSPCRGRRRSRPRDGGSRPEGSRAPRPGGRRRRGARTSPGPGGRAASPRPGRRGAAGPPRRKELREDGPAARVRELRGRVLLHDPFSREEPVEAAEGRRRPRQAARGGALRPLLAEPGRRPRPGRRRRSTGGVRPEKAPNAERSRR